MCTRWPLYSLTVLLFIFSNRTLADDSSSVAGKIICIDPGHGGTALTDHYRVGPGGEREEWINLRVGLLLRDLLVKKGAKVIMTRTTDIQVPLAERAALAVNNKANLLVSIHHNATADSTVNFPIIYFDGAASENLAGVAFGKALAASLRKYFYRNKTIVSLVSDFSIFPLAGAAVLRGSYGIPGLLAEASFFTNAEEEKRLKQETHNADEANAYLIAMEDFFKHPVPAIKAKKIATALPPFRVFEEADRMTPVAREWLNDYNKALQLQKRRDTPSLNQAYELFTRSAKSFPDSYVAGNCHKYRAELLDRLNRTEEAAIERMRFREFYIKVD
ncbi:MAG: N-acetylmuramoyl-L-alanine amidase [Chitinophagaceae bacterium]